MARLTRLNFIFKLRLARPTNYKELFPKRTSCKGFDIYFDTLSIAEYEEEEILILTYSDLESVLDLLHDNPEITNSPDEIGNNISQHTFEEDEENEEEHLN